MRRTRSAGLSAGLPLSRAYIHVNVPALEPDAVRRIRRRYDRIPPGAFAEVFFAHLFAAMPDVRPMLPADLVMHGEHVEAAVAVVLRNLADLHVLIRPLEALGAEHLQRGIHAGHLVGAHPVLMATIRSLAGGQWSPDDERDWSRAFSAMLAPMVRGAAAATAVVSPARARG